MFAPYEASFLYSSGYLRCNDIRNGAGQSVRLTGVSGHSEEIIPQCLKTTSLHLFHTEISSGEKLIDGVSSGLN